MALYIRDDGVIAHGNGKFEVEQASRWKLYKPSESTTEVKQEFNISTADKDELIKFAYEKHSMRFKKQMELDKLRDLIRELEAG